MAEIRIERKWHGSLYTWVLGLVLLVVVILGAVTVASHRRQPEMSPVHRTGAEAADTGTQWDDIPPKLRQYA